MLTGLLFFLGVGTFSYTIVRILQNLHINAVETVQTVGENGS
jgi:hypothetical protein